MTAQPTATSCIHYWLLGDLIPGQPRDQGTCKYCGVIKVFKSSLSEVTFQEIQNVVRPDNDSVIRKYMMENMKREI